MPSPLPWHLQVAKQFLGRDIDMYTNCPHVASGFDGPGMFQWFWEPRGRENSDHHNKPQVKEMLMTGDDDWSLVPECVVHPNNVASALHTS